MSHIRAVSEHEAFRVLMKDLHEQFGVDLAKSCRSFGRVE